MGTRRIRQWAGTFTGALLLAMVSVAFFLVLFAPGWPKTILGWGIAVVVGLPVFVLSGGVTELVLGPPSAEADGMEHRYSLDEVRAGTPARARGRRRAARILLVIGGSIGMVGILWLIWKGLKLPFIRAQFQ